MKAFTKWINETPVEIHATKLNTDLLYICESGKQVGSLLLVYDNNGDASIYSVEVLSSHRGKGYGKKLVENAIQHCQMKGVKSIELNTELDNTVANNLYLNLGFRVQGIRDGFNNYKKLL